MIDKSTPFHSTYLLSADHDGQQIVSIHLKKTYKLDPDGACIPADVNMPLLAGELTTEEGEEPFPETDILPFKNATDLIVMATAYGNNRPHFTAGIRVPNVVDLRYLVLGERKAIYRGKGSIAFTDPEPFDSVPLRYENAYGGVDPAVPDPEIEYAIDFFQEHPGVYPRNPVGLGYVVTDDKEAIDGRMLPRIENLDDLLTPQRLVSGLFENWWRQPLPWSCDWFDKSWYPRAAHYRYIPSGIPDDDKEVPEVKAGWLDPYQNEWSQVSLDERPINYKIADAATPSLVLPFLKGDESIELTGMTPDGKIVVQLPGRPPTIQLRYEGRTHEIVPRPHRVLISTEEMGVYVVWHGAWYPPRVLGGRLPKPDDPPASELEGIEVTVDGKLIRPLGEIAVEADDGSVS